MTLKIDAILMLYHLKSWAQVLKMRELFKINFTFLNCNSNNIFFNTVQVLNFCKINKNCEKFIEWTQIFTRKLLTLLRIIFISIIIVLYNYVNKLFKFFFHLFDWISYSKEWWIAIICNLTYFLIWSRTSS